MTGFRGTQKIKSENPFLLTLSMFYAYVRSFVAFPVLFESPSHRPKPNPFSLIAEFCSPGRVRIGRQAGRCVAETA